MAHSHSSLLGYFNNSRFILYNQKYFKMHNWISAGISLLFYHNIWLRSPWACCLVLLTLWAEPEEENISYLRLFLHLPNTVTHWCLLWCTEVQLDWLNFSRALYSPEEQFCLSVSDTAYAIPRQLCLTAKHTPSSRGYEESGESLYSCLILLIEGNAMNQMCQAWTRPRKLTVVIRVVLLGAHC